MQTRQSKTEYILPSSTATAGAAGDIQLILSRRWETERRRKRNIPQLGRSDSEGVNTATHKHSSLLMHLEENTVSGAVLTSFSVRLLRIFTTVISFVNLLGFVCLFVF